MSDDKHTYLNLPDGLRVVHVSAPGYVEYCGLAVKAGSRDDPHNLHGLAHFVEHTIFKGTTHRRSWHIINRMEAVGGELNAYTTKEETMVYSIFPAGNLRRATELLYDLVTSSIFPQSEIEREREVVCDEINSYLDTPSEAVFDEFEEAAFEGSNLAHNILGSVDSVERITSADCREYLQRHYRPDNMVFFYMGPESPSTLERVLAKSRSAHPRVTTPTPTLQASAPHFSPTTFNITRDISSHQAHTVMGALLPGMYQADRYALSLLTNLLGGPGMNSRLNVALRERRGLVYTVEASTALLTDTGLFTIYFGCDPSDTARCTRLAQNEIARLADTPMPAIALERAKKQYLGQLMVASDNREQVALSTARATLYHGRAASSEQIRERVMGITPDSLLSAAQSIANLSSLTLS